MKTVTILGFCRADMKDIHGSVFTLNDFYSMFIGLKPPYLTRIFETHPPEAFESERVATRFEGDYKKIIDLQLFLVRSGIYLLVNIINSFLIVSTELLYDVKLLFLKFSCKQWFIFGYFLLVMVSQCTWRSVWLILRPDVPEFNYRL